MLAPRGSLVDARPAPLATLPDRLLATGRPARFRIGQGLLGLALLAVLLVAGDAPAALRAPVVLLAAALVPGWALVARLRADLLTLITLDVCVSAAIDTLAAVATVQTRTWHPFLLGLGIAVVSCGAILLSLHHDHGVTVDRAPRARRSFEPHWLVPAAALGLWVTAVSRLHIDNKTVLGPLGLVPRLGLPYWIGLIALLVSTAVVIQQERVRHGLVVLDLAVLSLMLYATSAVVEDVPRYAYLYKHLGITQYIERFGHVDTSIDIYHRWPGFFSVSAWFSQLAGLPDPTSYAAWSELAFGFVDLLLVRAVAQAVTRSSRAAWSAALVFAVCNWVGQDYYSPQAMGYLLMLGLALCVVLALQGPSGRLGQRVERLVARVLRVRVLHEDAVPSMPPRETRRVIVLLLVLDVALVMTHQLTPYVLCLQLVVLAALGLLRPWYVALATVGLTAAYLIPNYDYVSSKFGLVSAPDPLANATTQLMLGSPLPTEQHISMVAAASFLGVFGFGLIGMLRRARTGHVRQALVVAVMAFSPVLLLAANDYGGEARLRVLLYAMPWCCIGMTWIWSPRMTRVTGLRLAAPVSFAVAAGLAFVVLFYGHEDQALLSQGEIGTAAWAADPSIVPPGSAIVVTAADFPIRYGALYYHLPADPPTLIEAVAGVQGLTPAQATNLTHVRAFLRKQVYSPAGHAYLVFSRAQEAEARDLQLYGPDTPAVLKHLEDEVAQSPHFKLVYLQQTARVYQLVD